MRRRPVRKLRLAATRQAACCSGSLSQTLRSTVAADLAPLSHSFKDNQDFSVNVGLSRRRLRLAKEN